MLARLDPLRVRAQKRGCCGDPDGLVSVLLGMVIWNLSVPFCSHYSAMAPAVLSLEQAKPRSVKFGVPPKIGVSSCGSHRPSLHKAKKCHLSRGLMGAETLSFGGCTCSCCVALLAAWAAEPSSAGKSVPRAWLSLSESCRAGKERFFSHQWLSSGDQES